LLEVEAVALAIVVVVVELVDFLFKVQLLLQVLTQ
jgi:hypothetical protein